MRSSGSASISLGLATVPVKLYTAVSSAETVTFRQLHAACGSPIRLQSVCSKDGAELTRDDILKGYEFDRDQYVMFTAAEIEAMAQESDDTIAIREIVPADSLEPVFMEKTHYLGPAKAAAKAYSLLAAALKRSDRVALGSYNARGRCYFVCVRPYYHGLAMHTLHYPAAVRSFSELPAWKASVSQSEVEAASNLLAPYFADCPSFSLYIDPRRERILAAVEDKIVGRAIETKRAIRQSTIDLMDAIKQSMGEVAACQ